MATDLEKLVVQLSADITKYQKDLAKLNGVTNKQFNAVERRASQMNKRLDGIFANSFRGLIAPLSGVAAALSVREVSRYADAWTVAGNKLAAASQISGMQARSLQDLNVIANETRGGIAETADLYAKLMRSTKGVAESEMQVAKATEIVNKAFKAGGAAASEQAAGIMQLGQGLGSGILQGDELRSLRENAPLLAQAITDYFKVSIAGLKDLGAEGKSSKGSGGGSGTSVKKTADSRFEADIQSVPDRTAALLEEVNVSGLAYQEQEKRRMALDLEQAALADLREEARKKGQTDLDSIKLSPEHVAKINEVSAAYAQQAEELRKVQEAQSNADQAAGEF